MQQIRNRKYPRAYGKKNNHNSGEKQRVLDLSAGTAVGILAAAFANGLFLGYMIKKKFG